ncbi:MAG: MMPL family transporter, partial [Phycisphaeraceae bacterium]
MLDRLRHQFLGRLSRLISHWPRSILLVALLLAAGSAVLTIFLLEFQASRSALISRELPWNQRYLKWQEDFPAGADLVVVVDAFEADEPAEQARGRAERFVETLVPRLEELPVVGEVLWGFDPGEVTPRALRLQPMPEFRDRLTQLAQSETLLTSPTPAELMEQAMSRMQQAGGGAGGAAAGEGIAGFQRIIEAFQTRLQTPAEQDVDLYARVADGDQLGGWRFLETDNGRFLFIRVTLARDLGTLTDTTEALEQVRGVLAEMREQYPELEFGMTGAAVIQADETAAAMYDSTLASIIATVLITILLVTAFHSFRVPLLLVTALLVGVVWSFGFLTLTIGHLQVISVVFAVILLGLGVAFGIHVASRFELIRHQYADTERGFRDALQDTLETIGPGILTGALTTAAAFCTTLLTEFTGVAEMGGIAAAGILLCLIAMCTVFPALLRIYKPFHRHVVPMEKRFVHLYDDRWVMPFVRRPKRTIVIGGLIVLASAAGISQIGFDYNLLALLPADLQSVVWQRRVVEQGGQSAWYGVAIVDDMEKAREAARQFRNPRLGALGELGGVGLLIPPEDEAERKRELLEQVRQDVGPAAAEAINASEVPEDAETDLLRQLRGLQLALSFAGLQAPDALRPQLAELQTTVTQTLQQAARLPEAEREARLAALDADYQQWREQVARQVSQALAPGPVRVSDLPESLMSSYISREGPRRYTLEVYPDLPEGVEDPLAPEFLGTFVAQLRAAADAADVPVTGSIVQIYESGELIKRSYMRAGVYA